MSQNTSDVEQEEQHCAHAMQLVTSVAVPFVLNVLIELQVLEILAKARANAGLSAKEIASQFPTNNLEAASMLYRMLRLLEMMVIMMLKDFMGCKFNQLSN
ncbi:hypothetical protein LIER_20719 [Lithospermum erythrorhizon]|uniref:O-methyltransferase dimerisation domain-containing protein n=1 Tax=Lithospermum erythrorhizon TaxID=34254 RepID=A0AAV3QMH0_LITER